MTTAEKARRAAYAHNAESIDLIDRIKMALEQPFEKESMDWGDVGTQAEAKQKLAELAAFLNA